VRGYTNTKNVISISVVLRRRSVGACTSPDYPSIGLLHHTALFPSFNRLMLKYWIIHSLVIIRKCVCSAPARIRTYVHSASQYVIAKISCSSFTELD